MQDQLEIIENKSDSTVLNDEYYESGGYLQLIPKANPKWILSPLNFDHEFELIGEEIFEPTDLKQSHKHYTAIRESFDIFNELNKINIIKPDDDDEMVQNPDENGWKIQQSIEKDETHLNIYHNKTAQFAEYTRSEMVFPFSSAVICGIFCNNEHYTAIDENILSCKILKQSDNHSYCVYAECNKPFPFSNNRDLLMVRFCYIFENGQFIFGEKSINDQELEDMVKNNLDEDADHDNLIRADCINLWHGKPVGDDNGHCKVTHFCRYGANGDLAKFILPLIKMDKAKHLLKLYEYVHEIQKLLHIEGQLYIPPKLLNLMDIHESLLRPNGEDVKKKNSDSQLSPRSNNDDNIIDLNLAVQTVIFDVKGFINNMTSNQNQT